MTLEARDEELIERYLDGMASPDELRALDLRLREPSVAAALARRARLDAQLATIISEDSALQQHEPLQLPRARQRLVMPVLLAAAVVLAFIGWQLGREGASPQPRHAVKTASSAAENAVELADGSRVRASPSGSVRIVQQTPREVVLELASGTAHFDVKHDPGRTFKVVAGFVTVEDLGTSFTIERSEAQVTVTVRQGSVRASAPSETVQLLAGESRTFEARATTASPPLAASSMAEPRATSSDAGQWRNLAKRGEYARAFESLNLAGASAVHDEPQDLMLAADTARLSNHSHAAVAPLRKLLSRHRSDPRAPAAAFTLGRVLLDELGRPAEAAAAFADARALIGGGALAEDALAREVEAWAKAGRAEKARERAALYVASFPRGRKLQSVRRYGNLP